MQRLTVALGERSYDILIGERLLARAGEHIAPVLAHARVIVISDETVARLYLHRLTGALEEAGIAAKTLLIPAGEGSKSWEIFGDLLERLLELKPDRHTTLIALGGGVVGDITGFAASIALRGLDFIQIPTTLLAQVDSSVGGKTGINSRFGKNLIGSFHQPRLVLADSSVLATLPKREMLAGYAEVVKYGLINDAPFFSRLEANGAAMLGTSPSPLTGEGRGGGECPLSANLVESHPHPTLPRQGGGLELSLLAQSIHHSCAAKAAIVAADENEQGNRALLNLGHTFGHALEAECGYGDTLLHGEAVAIGMCMAFDFSAAQGLCPPEDAARVRAHLHATGLPTTPQAIRPDWNIDALMEHFTRDKKASGGGLTFILARGIGRSFVARNVEPAALREYLTSSLAAHD